MKGSGLLAKVLSPLCTSVHAPNMSWSWGAIQRILRVKPDRSRSPRRGTASNITTGSGGARQRVQRQDVIETHENEQRNDFRVMVADMFLKNKFSGLETLKLVKAAHGAGACGVSDLSSGSSAKHAARDLLRKLQGNCSCPSLYWANIPLWDKAKQNVAETPFHLFFHMK